MISDDQIRALCREAIAERDRRRLEELLALMRSLCAQYVEERFPFLTRGNGYSGGNGNRSAGVRKPDKRAA